MTTELLLRYLHFISIFAIVGSLVSEHLLLKKRITRGELARLARIDGVYGIAALVLLAAGLTLWLGGFGKPTVFYSKNFIFHIKLTLSVLLGLISIYPTVFFLRQRKGAPEEEVAVPGLVFWSILVELLLLLIMPFLAGMMAKGIGFFG